MSDEAIVPLVIELIEKVGLLRRELQHNQDLDKYERLAAAGPEPGVSQRRAPEGPVRHVVRVGGRCPLIYPFSPTV
jgi:hypothetical protein